MKNLYRIFSDKQVPPTTNLSNEEILKLNEKLSECSKKFQDVPCSFLDETAETLIPDYIKIYTNDNTIGIKLIETQENLVFENIENLTEAGDKIIEEMKGLPEAAMKISYMYEVIGIYNLALLWAYVSYKMGFSQSKKEAQRLLNIINKE